MKIKLKKMKIRQIKAIVTPRNQNSYKRILLEYFHLDINNLAIEKESIIDDKKNNLIKDIIEKSDFFVGYYEKEHEYGEIERYFFVKTTPRILSLLETGYGYNAKYDVSKAMNNCYPKTTKYNFSKDAKWGIEFPDNLPLFTFVLPNFNKTIFINRQDLNLSPTRLALPFYVINIVLALLFYSFNIPLYYYLLIFFVSIITFTLLGAFELRSNRTLNENNFMELIKIVFSKLIFANKWLGKKGDE
jgi:hypothetical protein